MMVMGGVGGVGGVVVPPALRVLRVLRVPQALVVSVNGSFPQWCSVQPYRMCVHSYSLR
jgi:hypothetical protein